MTDQSRTPASSAELGPAAVRAFAQAIDLVLTDDDLAEVTHRLNAFIQALAPLRDLPLDGPEPVPAPVDPDRA